MTYICVQFDIIIFKPPYRSIEFFSSDVRTSSKLSSETYVAVSSAKLYICLHLLGRIITNHTGKSWKAKVQETDPWVKPNIISFQELKTLLIFILWFQFDKWLNIIAEACLLNPQPCSFANSNWCFIVSKALSTSINIPSAKLLLHPWIISIFKHTY